jgi:hypothetical protein
MAEAGGAGPLRPQPGPGQRRAAVAATCRTSRHSSCAALFLKLPRILM